MLAFTRTVTCTLSNSKSPQPFSCSLTPPSPSQIRPPPPHPPRPRPRAMLRSSRARRHTHHLHRRRRCRRRRRRRRLPSLPHHLSPANCPHRATNRRDVGASSHLAVVHPRCSPPRTDRSHSRRIRLCQPLSRCTAHSEPNPSLVALRCSDKLCKRTRRCCRSCRRCCRSRPPSISQPRPHGCSAPSPVTPTYHTTDRTA
jgi:hypothetical protein